jgi:uncharacterized repeat protein (TIGR01451 family)
VVVGDQLQDGFNPPAPFLPGSTFAPSQGTYNDLAGVWSIGDLEVGARATLQIFTQVYEPGMWANEAQVDGNEDDPVDENDAASVSVRVLENDVAVTKTVDNPTPPLGETVTYTIRVTNHGPDAADQVAVLDIVTSGSTAFVSATATQGTIESAVPLPGTGFPPALRWNITSLPVGVTETLTLVRRITSLGPSDTTAVADPGLHEDTARGNNRALATIVGQPTADLVVTKRVSEATPAIGDTVTFTVTVTNNGPGEATGIQVSDGLPAGLTLVSFAPSQGTYDPATGM